MTIGGAVEVGPLIHLLIAIVLATIYAYKKEIVVLPALMLTSLIGSMLNLGIHPFLLGIADFATTLIVFVAGLELKKEFLLKEKERILITFLLEALLLMLLLQALLYFLPFPIAIAITAIMIASNEAFTIELRRIDERLSQFGITLSILEDALALFLLSVGFFTSLSIAGATERVELLVITSVIIMVALYLASKPLSRYLRSIERTDTKLLVLILYMVSLVALSQFVGIPEVIPVFIGAVTLSLRWFDEETYNAIHGYFILALMGFVASLPYKIPGRTLSSGHLHIILLGLALGFAAYAIRFALLVASSLLGGLPPPESLALALAMANTGEFGLIVLSSLSTSRGIIPPDIAYAAMLAYAVNLTLTSEVSKRLSSIVERIEVTLKRTKLYAIMDLVSRESRIFIEEAAASAEFKKDIVKLSIAVAIVYSAYLLYNSVLRYPIFGYSTTLLLLAAFVLSIQEIYGSFTEDVKRFKRPSFVIPLVLKLATLYLVVAPILTFIEALYFSGRENHSYLPLYSPITLLGILVLTYLLDKVTEKIAYTIIRGPEEELEAEFSQGE